MFSSSQLSDDQKNAIRQWAEDGAQMAEIQKRMNDLWQIRVTYMDTRFLILDLGITLKTEVKEEPKKEEPADTMDPDAETGGVSVSRDEIVIPGMMFSGKVQFSDGEKPCGMSMRVGAWVLIPIPLAIVPPRTTSWYSKRS